MANIETQPEKKYSRSPNRIDNDAHLLPPSFLASANRAGTKKLFSPAQLFQKAKDYFKETENKPIYSNQVITGGAKGGDTVKVEKPRMFTIEGFCIYCNINLKYLNFIEYSIEGKEDDESIQYSNVINYIRTIIRQQRFENAAVNEMNPMFIAKLEGLTDRIEHSGEVKNTVTSIRFVQSAVQDAEFSIIQDQLDNE